MTRSSAVRRPPLGRAFRALWAATALANLGDGLALFLLPVLAVALTDSPGVVAGVTVMLTLAWPLFGLHAGGIVDRVDRRRLLLGANLARAAVAGAVGLAALADVASIPLVYVAAAVLGVTETLVDTGLTTMVPAVVPRRELARANGRVEAAQNVANQFVGPPLAGALAAQGLALANAAAAAAYAGAVVALTRVRGAFAPAAPPATSAPATADADEPARDRRVTAGLAFVWHDPLLRALTIVTAAMNVLWAAWTALLPVYALDAGAMGLSEAGYGLLLTAMAAGGVAGALAVGPLTRRLGVRAVLALDLVGTALLVGVPALTPDPVAVAAAIVVGGAGSAVWRVIVATLRQDIVPDALLGRVYSASRTLSFGALPLGAALAGALAEAIGVRATFAAAGVAAVALLVAAGLTLTPSRLARAGPAGPGGFS